MLEITPDLVDTAVEMNDLLASHVVEGYVRSSDFFDGQLLQTSYANAVVRINMYSYPKKVWF